VKWRADQAANQGWIPRRARTVSVPASVGDDQKVASSVSMRDRVGAASEASSLLDGLAPFSARSGPTFLRMPRDLCEASGDRHTVHAGHDLTLASGTGGEEMGLQRPAAAEARTAAHIGRSHPTDRADGS